MKVVFIVPRRSDGGRRDQLWAWTSRWLEQHHTYPIIEGDSPESDGPFNRGRAINRAANSTPWDVAIIHDGDNISRPETLHQAVEDAHTTGQTVYPFTYYHYLDEHSSELLMTTGEVWPAPDPTRATPTLLKHFSGVQVIPRTAWEKIGGFPELSGWGAEDTILSTLLDVFAGGQKWLPGATLHLWHEHNPEHDQTRANRLVWTQVKRLARRRDKIGLRDLLTGYGVTIP